MLYLLLICISRTKSINNGIESVVTIEVGSNNISPFYLSYISLTWIYSVMRRCGSFGKNLTKTTLTVNLRTSLLKWKAI